MPMENSVGILERNVRKIVQNRNGAYPVSVMKINPLKICIYLHVYMNEWIFFYLVAMIPCKVNRHNCRFTMHEASQFIDKSQILKAKERLR